MHVCRDCYVGRCGACNGLALTFDEDDEPRLRAMPVPREWPRVMTTPIRTRLRRALCRPPIALTEDTP